MSQELRDRLRRNREAIRQENAKWPTELVLVPKRDWPRHHDPERRMRLTHMRRSRHWIVQQYSEDNGIIRLSVSRTQVGKDGHYLEGITWDELQALKNECGFQEFDAVEVYPRQGHVVNVANMRHLWIMPAPLPFAWVRLPETYLCPKCGKPAPSKYGHLFCVPEYDCPPVQHPEIALLQERFGPKADPPPKHWDFVASEMKDDSRPTQEPAEDAKEEEWAKWDGTPKGMGREVFESIWSACEKAQKGAVE